MEHDLIHGVWHVDKGVLFTVKELILRPGDSVREFIQGKRVGFFSFVTLIILLLAISSLVAPFAKIHLADIMPLNSKQAVSAYEDFATKYPKIIMLILIPLYSSFSYFWFKKAKLNYSEHLVLNSYKTAVELILALLFTIVTIFYTHIPTLLIFYYVFIAIGGFLYSIWFYNQFFTGYGYSRTSKLLRAIMIPVSYLVFSMAIGFIMALIKLIN
ncbi:DUF3667 domain-containing protein [Pedobacter endophyticus]|uniref:DUF3667 domain-containing protein n=2 Tax=Pedobacter endophyticus TaxID=2789740 RepID=A0A7S9L3I8_9SPHI|nr:DUF3667 domain-containing protein [Pedobacter endophyticus]